MSNLKRLANWIIRHLSVNFADIVSLHKSYFLELSPSKQKEIETNQWPPIYYQKEKALYEKTLRQRALKEKSKHSRVPWLIHYYCVLRNEPEF